MNNQWKKDDVQKLFQFINNTESQRLSINESLKDPENRVAFFDELKKLLETDYVEFMDSLSEICIEEFMTDVSVEQFYQWVVEHSQFETELDFKNEIKYYTFLRNTIRNIQKSQQYFQIDEAIEIINSEKFKDNQERLLSYTLAKYYLLEKLNKTDFLFQKTKSAKTMYKLVKNSLCQDYDLLNELLYKFQQIQREEENRVKQKKIDKIIQKANKKLYGILKETKLSIQLSQELNQLKEETMHKLERYLTKQEVDDYQNITQFIERLEHVSNNLEGAIDNEITPEPVEKTITHLVDDKDLKWIERFYQQHHLYYKKTQITEELSLYPHIIQFYHFYFEIGNYSDEEEKIKKLEELVSDIHESGLKNKESLRRLNAEAQKEINDLINQEDEYEEEMDIPIYTAAHMGEQDIIQIGKFSVIKDSMQDHPVDLQKIIDLLSPESRHQVPFLENLIYQIGYDKVHAYVLKYPYLRIEDLNAVIKLDRSLRFEYQRILEDIEMYFRSSLTYFITNKYDQKYQIAEAQQYFYKRGYLMRNIFVDSQEHYEHVHQLRDRIDAEMKNNNLQVINEYKRYKYALPFSTAAGVMTFGWIIMLFENLNYRDKTDYLNKYFYHLSPQTFCHWMNSIANLRNKCAHYHSFYRLSSLKELRPIMTKDEDANGFDDDFKHSSLFYYTLVMTRLSPNIYNIEDFIDGIGILFRQAERDNSVFDLQKDYSFPKNWRMILENEKCAKIHYVR